MPSWLITGTNRGIGLGIVKHLLKDANNLVIATARNPSTSTELQSLQSEHPFNLFLVALDVTSDSSVASALSSVQSILSSAQRKGLDYLISNAGTNPQSHASFESADLGVFKDELETSIISPVRVTRAFLPLIKESNEGKVVFVTSVLGSLTVSYDVTDLENTYSVARAGLNMVGRKWAASLQANPSTAHLSVILVHPGWVQTDLGDALEDFFAAHPEMGVKRISVEESAEGVISVSKKVTAGETGRFWTVGGGNLPW